MKTLNEELYNYYEEEICYLSRQLELFELCCIPDCSKILERIMQYSKARDRSFESLHKDNELKAAPGSLY
jgi:hypothetical protein